MARDEAPPISRGTLFYHGVTADIPAAIGDRGYQQHLGKTWVVEDRNPTSKLNRTERPVTIRFVYNGHATMTILPKYLCTIDPTNPGKVTGYAVTVNEPGLPADEYMPAAGAPPGEGFFVIERGPATCKTAAADVTTNDITAGKPVSTATSGVAVTHASSGRIGLSDLTGTAAVASRIIGAALTAPTGGVEVSEDVVVDVGGRC